MQKAILATAALCVVTWSCSAASAQCLLPPEHGKWRNADLGVWAVTDSWGGPPRVVTRAEITYRFDPRLREPYLIDLWVRGDYLSSLYDYVRSGEIYLGRYSARRYPNGVIKLEFSIRAASYVVYIMACGSGWEHNPPGTLAIIVDCECDITGRSYWSPNLMVRDEERKWDD
jgi:hypothetical protein